jgi:small subunit ribosomal protein S4
VRRRASEWALQLREKQKARWTYGVLERQFRKYFETAREKPGITGDLLLQQLERRLDNVIYRLSFSDSRKQARQMVNHRHFQVNGRRLDIPSYLVKPNDVITWKGPNGSLPEFAQLITEGAPKRPVPTWLNLEVSSMTGQVLSLPDVTEIESGIDARLIVEFYSR